MIPKARRFFPAVFYLACLALLGFHLLTLSRPFPINDEGLTVNYAVFGRYQLLDHLPSALVPYSKAYAYGLQPLWIGCLRHVCAVLHPGLESSRVVPVLVAVGSLGALAFFIGVFEQQFPSALILVAYGFSAFFFRTSHTNRPDSVMFALALAQLAGVWFFTARPVGFLMGILGGLSLGVHLNAIYVLPILFFSVLCVQEHPKRLLPYLMWWGVGFGMGLVAVLQMIRVDEAIDFFSFASGALHSLGSPLLFDSRFSWGIRLSKALGSLEFKYPLGVEHFQGVGTAALLGAALASLRSWKTLSPFRRFAILNGLLLLGVFMLFSPVRTGWDTYYLFAYPWLLTAAALWIGTLKQADAWDVFALTCVACVILINQMAVEQWATVLFCALVSLRVLKSGLSRKLFLPFCGAAVLALASSDTLPAFFSYGHYLWTQHTVITGCITVVSVSAAFLVSCEFQSPARGVSPLVTVRSLLLIAMLVIGYDTLMYQRWDCLLYAQTAQEVQRVFNQADNRLLVGDPRLWLMRPDSDMQSIWPMWFALRQDVRLDPVVLFRAYGPHVQWVDSIDRIRLVQARTQPPAVRLTLKTPDCDALCLAIMDFNH